MSTKGSIYKATCTATGKSYVGQTRDTKTKAGKPYKYGITGRWNDHLTCPATTPLGTDITAFGPGAFVVSCLEADVSDDRLDEREAHWIQHEKTTVPHGYNVMRHGRCRHRDASSLSEFYAPTTVGVRLRQICRNGEPTLIYAYLLQKSGDEVRAVFGQGKDSTYTDAVRDAQAFLVPFAAVPIEADPRIFDTGAHEYSAKLARFDGQALTRIRVAKFNSGAAVYVDKERVCFIGRHTTYEEAIDKAMSFAHALHSTHPEATLVISVSKSATGGCPPS